MSIRYFNQTKEWSDFWQLANPGKGHKVLYFENQDLATYIYQYPLILGTFFWYIPRGFIVKNSSNFQIQAEQLLAKIIQSAKENNIIYLKFDIEQEFHFLFNESQKSEKKLQYLKTSILDVTEIGFEENIQQFWKTNKNWFETNFDKRTRYGTRKALDSNWQIRLEKSNENFEAFYKLHSDTAKRQKFGYHQKNYLEKLFDQGISRIIILRDELGEAQAGWLGISLGNNMTNLYGGNSLISRDKYGQYLLHLVALQICAQENLSGYDLGGLEEGKGFDLFKQGYKGNTREFIGPFDIILKPKLYSIYNYLRKLKS